MRLMPQRFRPCLLSLGIRKNRVESAHYAPSRAAARKVFFQSVFPKKGFCYG